MRATANFLIGAVLAAVAAIPSQPADAWVHRGWGGVSAGRVGEGWAHAGWGGVTEGRAGEGWAHAGWGGVTEGKAGEGWAHEGYYGGAAYGYHGDVTAVHNTFVTGAYPAASCWNCGAAAAAVGGLAIGAAAASAAQPSTTVVVQQGPAVGTVVSALPSGCQLMTVNGKTYYQCGSTWYKPTFGADGVRAVALAGRSRPT
ncbi:MAG: hypothetical protein MUF57_11115 [Gammaproteobacteria bacterium]|nr:hypothetical protein [Gammaproteobacteria bacterium]